jgi:hypothetical protein
MLNFKSNKSNIFGAFLSFKLNHCNCSRVGLINQEGLENASQDEMLSYLNCECPNKKIGLGSRVFQFGENLNLVDHNNKNTHEQHQRQ